jgi:hypothetical protein
MRAIVLEKFGGPDSLVIKEIPEPEPRAVHVVIQVKAFGINHAEMHMRRGEWANALHDDLATFNQVASNDPRHAGNALRPSHPFERGFSPTLDADRLTDNGGQRLVPRQ